MFEVPTDTFTTPPPPLTTKLVRSTAIKPTYHQIDIFISKLHTVHDLFPLIPILDIGRDALAFVGEKTLDIVESRASGTTSAHGNSYHRLTAIPCDVHPPSLTYEDARRVGVRECLGLKSFPSEFDLYGSLVSQSTAVGNAVPPLFAYDIAKAAMDTLSELNSESEKVPRINLVRRLIEFDKTVCETIQC